MTDRSDEIFVATRGGYMSDFSPPLTEEEEALFLMFWREHCDSEEAEKRDKHIYMSAIGGEGIDWMDPPPTSGERLLYEKRRAWAEAERAQAKAEGRTIVFDVPFDR
jgi:hypothetical protein